MPDESTILIETAQSVAHDFIDAIIRLKASERILQERVDSNSNSALAIIQERQRQIETLTSQVIELSGSKNELDALNAAIATLENDNASHLNTIRSLKITLGNFDQENTRLKDSFNRKQDELIEMEASLKAREEAIVSLNHKLDAALIYGSMKDEEIEGWALEEKKLRTEIEAVTAERDKLQKTVTSLTTPSVKKKRR